LKKHISLSREGLENIRLRYTSREFVHPDPVEFLYGYTKAEDREIVGLIASSLAYGRVTQILASVRKVLDHAPSPRRFLEDASERFLQETFSDFRHRFTKGEHLALLLWKAKKALKEFGSLQACFLNGMDDSSKTFVPAMCAFADRMGLNQSDGGFSLVPSPRSGSACKRLNLYLRWMVRRDNVDVGDWDLVPTSKLIVPLDTHMHRIALRLGLTQRKQADLRTALEITEGFRRFDSRDPVRYDFALTRFGIRSDFDLSLLFEEVVR